MFEESEGIDFFVGEWCMGDENFGLIGSWLGFGAKKVKFVGVECGGY